MEDAETRTHLKAGVRSIAELSPYRKRDRLETDPLLSRVVVKCDLVEPLTEAEWDAGA